MHRNLRGHVVEGLVAMKKILVTGSSGYIGSHLCNMLTGKYIVHGLDLVPSTIRLDKFYQMDITDTLWVDEEYDAVIHLAALVNVGVSERIPIKYYDTNLNGTLNVLSNIQTNNFIFASTGQANLCINPYSISKRAAEDCVHSWCSTYTIFRFYNVVGSEGILPTNPDGLLSSLIRATKTGKFTIFGDDYDTPDGTCVRDYVHVNEICRALMTAIEEPANGLENLGHGQGKSVHEMVDIFKKVNDVEFVVDIGPRKKGDPPVSVLDVPGKYMKHLYEFEDLLKIAL
jgi:UDP-glucose 4-epimerase